MATIYTVTQLNACVGNLFHEDFLLAGLHVQGGLSNVKYHASGHIYLTLKDNDAELRGIIYRQNALSLDMRLVDGMQMVCTGAMTVYEKAGVYQLNTKTVEELGQGELYALCQARLRALGTEGLFDVTHKEPPPRFVLTFGVAMSPSDAAIHDIQIVARQQNPYVKIVFYPALVQGEGMAESTVRRIRTLDRRSVDLMTVGRDGGSLKDLWCFNDERIARVTYTCETPLISAVGHESDMALPDLIADLRAATPSITAEHGVPSLAAQPTLVTGLRQQLLRELRERVGDLRTCVGGAGFRLRLNAPEGLLNTRRQHTLALQQGFEVGLNKKIQAQWAALQLLAAHLRVASPSNRLTDGCACIAHADGTAVQNTASLSTEERLNLRFLNGVAEVRVEEVRGEQQKKSHGRKA